MMDNKNTELCLDNAKLRSDNAKLRSDNAKLLTDIAKLRSLLNIANDMDVELYSENVDQIREYKQPQVTTCMTGCLSDYYGYISSR